MTGVKNRYFLRFKRTVIFSALTLASNLACAQGAQSSPEWLEALNKDGKPITVFTAKQIYTMDPGRPEATAVAVLDGKVLSTGSIESMQPWLSRYDYTINDTLKDKVITPGFIEPHSHMWMSAGFMSATYIGPLDWPGRDGMQKASPTHADVIETLKQTHANETDKTKPLIAWGFDPANHGGGLNREELDAISTERPIYVIGFAPHFVYLNSPAIKATGVTSDTKIHGVYKNSDGTLSGVFNENLAVQAALGPVFKDIMAMGGVGGLQFMANIANKAGVTTVAEMLYGAFDFDAEWNDTLTATNNPDFPIRIQLIADGQTMSHKFKDKSLATYADFLPRNTDKAYVKGIKFFTDGSLPLMSSKVNYPGYLDGKNGSENAIPWADLTKTMAPYWNKGIQIHIHANGDMALDQALDSLEELQHAKPRFDHRYTIEHFSISNSMQPRRIKALGALVSGNPYFTSYRSLLHSEHAYGPDRSEAFGRYGSLAREGVIFALHSDYPQVVVPMLPLTAVWTVVNRIAEDGKTVVAPGEAISVERAMRAITIDAAYTLGVEDKIGSLEPGKHADFTVLESDPYKVSPNKIKDVPVWGTVMGGNIFEAKN
ncbi:amidohydrolase [Shewanella olleyana]|uniref:amidohydrolase n=1 Tax=Shewanella olleyana TaxID=135626 RepID=UPI00200E79C7|nr:amidohydrolase [Shewanella olleyana]MCL1065367.1 amidohydrolase [Shewanella olleyana]